MERDNHRDGLLRLVILMGYVILKRYLWNENLSYLERKKTIFEGLIKKLHNNTCYYQLLQNICHVQ